MKQTMKDTPSWPSGTIPAEVEDRAGRTAANVAKGDDARSVLMCWNDAQLEPERIEVVAAPLRERLSRMIEDLRARVPAAANPGRLQGLEAVMLDLSAEQHAGNSENSPNVGVAVRKLVAMYADSADSSLDVSDFTELLRAGLHISQDEMADSDVALIASSLADELGDRIHAEVIAEFLESRLVNKQPEVAGSKSKREEQVSF